MKNYKLRDYQQEASDSIVHEWEETASTLLLMATGGGKTTVCMDVIERYGGKALIVAHREELIIQARDTIISGTGLACEVEMAEWSAHSNGLFQHDVLVATIQTLNARNGDRKRMGKFKPEDYGLMMIDEAHHATSQSYRNVINYFAQNHKLRIVGPTATADRYDEESLGQIFKTVAYEWDILDGIHGGWLVPIDQYSVTVSGLDFSHISVTAGELNQGELASVMEAESVIQRVVHPTIETAYGLPEHTLSSIPVPQWGAYLATLNMRPKQTLIFTVSVKQAETLSNIFNRVRQGMSNWVCGETNKEDRRDMLRDYQNRKFPIIVNCDCLSEGWDSPSVEVVVQARPTRSRCKYAQQIGRGMRALPGVVDDRGTSELRKVAIAASAKPKLIVMDFVGNSGKHKLMSAVDILGGKVSDDVLDKAKRRIESIGKPTPVANVIDQIREEEEQKRRKAEAARLADEARKAHLKLVGKSTFKTQFIDPFSAFGMTPVKMRGWDVGKTLTEREKALLARQGINPEIPYEQGKQAIRELFRRWDKKLATAKQCKYLTAYGYDTQNMTKEEATKLLDQKWGKK